VVGFVGGVCFGLDGNEVIFVFLDVVDMMEDDVMLMIVLEGIVGGVWYGWIGRWFGCWFEFGCG